MIQNPLDDGRESEESEGEGDDFKPAATHQQSSSPQQSFYFGEVERKRKKDRGAADDMVCGIDGCLKVFHSSWDLSRHQRCVHIVYGEISYSSL
jgi:hypothetical protein